MSARDAEGDGGDAIRFWTTPVPLNHAVGRQSYKADGSAARLDASVDSCVVEDDAVMHPCKT